MHYQSHFQWIDKTHQQSEYLQNCLQSYLPYFFPYPNAVASAIENPSVEIVPPTVGNVKFTEPLVMLPPICALPEMLHYLVDQL